MKILSIIAIAMATAACALGVYQIASKPSVTSVCMVRMQSIMDRYQGAIDAGSQMQSRQLSMQNNVDSVLKVIAASTESDPRRKEEQAQQYMRYMEQATRQQQEQLSKQLMAQVRAASESVADSKGISMVIAITDESFVLSKTPSIDITEEVLTVLKKTYVPGTKKTM